MNKSEMIEELERRVLVMAPTARDARLSRRILTEGGLEGLVCEDLAALCREIEAGAGAVVLIDAFHELDSLASLLQEQPPWSDLPVILLARSEFDSRAAAVILETLGNVVLLTRPVRVATLLSTLRTGLRARARQYQLRSYLTERERQLAALRDNEERLRLATSAAGAGIWRWDLATDRQIWDRRCKTLFGLPLEAEASYQRWLDLLHPEDRPRLLASVPQFIDAGKEHKDEYRVIRPDGSVRWLMVRGAISRNGMGQPEQLTGIVIDITDRKKMEEALRRAKEAADSANKAKSEFLANMSHEIRTPLTVTMGAIELLQGTALSEEQRHFLGMAQSSSENLLRLIEDLLDFSRIEAGRMTFRQEPFDLRACVENTVQAFHPEAQRKGLRLDLEIEGAPGIVVGDSDRLHQVLYNLVDNAVKFTEQGGVTVTVRPESENPDHVAFAVSDTGIGIPEEKMGLLFQAFSQLDSSHTRRYGGTGLGLILSKRLLARMDGSIQVESTPGEGSVFSFCLPLPPAEERPPKPAAVPAVQWESGGAPRACRILLAEDDPPVRELIEEILRRRQWEVVTANDGEEALAAWEAGSFDLILMDVQMPELGGLEAARQIREKESEQDGGHIPIIALTAHARQEDRDLCRQAGMDDFISKPIRIADLYATIERRLGEEEM